MRWPWRRQPTEQSQGLTSVAPDWKYDELPTKDKVDLAMTMGLVDLVEKLLGPAPVHMYDYGMQPEWIKSARQWVSDKRLPPAVYPVHCWSAGYGGPQTPLTWYSCQSCGNTCLGGPDKLPERDCHICVFAGVAFAGWAVAERGVAASATQSAMQGLPAHSASKVLRGP